MMKSCLIWVMSPTQVISGLSGVLAKHDSRAVEVEMVVHAPGGEMDLQREIGDVVREMTKGMKWVRGVREVSEETVLGLEKKYIEQGDKNAVGRAVGIDGEIDEIYYAHDVVGHWYQLMCLAFPKAKRICVGDALGMVFEKKVHLGLLGIKVEEPQRRQWWRWIGKGKARRNAKLEEVVWPDEARLILPVDQSGRFLKRVRWEVVEKQVVVELLEEMIEGMEGLNSYMRDLVRKYGKEERLLLLTDNIAEGGFMELEKEVEMYESMVRENLGKDGVVFLKSHPGEILPRNQMIKQNLKGDYEVVILKEKYKRFPVELWKELVKACKVVGISYPVLSLKYLWGVEMTMMMNNDFIEKWFPERTWKSYKNSAILYLEPLRRLSSWDGRGRLWGGGGS